MSDSEDMDNFVMSDEASDFEEAPAPKKKGAAAKTSAPKAKASTSSKKGEGKADNKKSTGASVKPKKKAAPTPDENNAGESDDDAMDQDPPGSSSDVDTRPPPKKAAPKNATEQYQKLSQLEHVLKRPDTYIGSTEPSTQQMWVYEKGNSSMKLRQCTFVPGLYKIFDEILVNAADNKQNDASMNMFKVEINREEGCISVYNNGKGIPVEIHGKEGIWIPELIFGHLLTSSNYDDDQRKVTGGRNGYGAKLANIYSTKFTVETADKRNVDGQGIYKQTWTDNMSKCGKPSVKDNKKGDEYTRVTFYPDFNRFNMQGLDDDTEALLMKRVYDMAGTVHGVKVYLNGTNLSTKIKSFKQYVEMYAKAAQEMNGGGGDDNSLVGAGPEGSANSKPAIIHERVSDRWEIAFAPSDGQFSQTSFVNSIATTKGGTHVEHVTKQLVEQIVAVVNKKTKTMPVKPFQVKNHLWVFVNCSIENPSFDSQTKEHMTLAQTKFGSKCKISDEFTKKVIKSGVVESVLSYAKFKQDQALKKTDGSKRSRVTGISKLEDANKAGSKEGHKCTLILTEGDSAKALAVAGLGVVGRDFYGVFPLRGKLLNVRDANGKQLTDNAEIQAIKQIMGLQHQKVYKDTTGLRYGHLMIMTDQDHDGSHIKGLIINYFDYYYPSLLKCSDFLIEFITPIVKVWKGRSEKVFFTMPEYESWKDDNNGGRGWQNKYYKGLGTSTAQDAKKYFSDMSRHRLPFETIEDNDRSLIDMAFNKKKADDRKEWLRGYVPGTFLDHNVDSIPMSDFINKELILFSMADNARSIPCVIDGLKPGQRKVLFGCFKRKLKKEIKVAQLQGYVSEHTAYHHGETSLMATIIGLAQSFVGSNNINLLEPNGQFGTRLQGGKDAASPRYIFTNLTSLTRSIFNPADDPLLEYLTDDGQSIEPTWYMPILPMILVNGSDGIGTGWSSSIPNYNPRDIVDNIKRKLRGEDVVPMEPWFRGFEGEIQKTGNDKYKTLGIWEQDDDVLSISELPLRTWTQNYKDLISAWSQSTEKTPAIVKDLEEHHTDMTVSFKIHLAAPAKSMIKSEGVEKAFKLSSHLTTSNMVAFDAHGKIKKYNTPEEILEDFYDVRLDFYHRRKANLLNEMSAVHDKLSNQARFILAVIAAKLVISRRKKADVVGDMRAMDFKPIPKLPKKPDSSNEPEGEEEEEEEVVNAGKDQVGRDSDFDYCLGMPMSSLTLERVQKLEEERDEQARQIEELSGLSPKTLWERDLDSFMEEWEKCLDADTAHRASAQKEVKGKGRAKAAKKKAAYTDDDDEDDYAPGAKKKASPKSKKTSPKAKKETAAPKKEKKASPKRELESDAEKPAPKPPAKKAKKTAVSDDDEVEAKPVKKAPAAKKTAKAPPVKVEDEDDEDDDDDDIFVSKASSSKAAAPAKKKAAAATASSSKKPAAAAAAAAKSKPAPKAKTKAMDLDSESDEDVKAASDSPPPAPRARTARGATKKPAYQEVNLSDDEDEASAFDEDEDEE